jgi:hypothetical protein
MLTERTLRNKAHDIGCHVTKGFMHFGEHVFYNRYGERSVGYMVQDLSTGFYAWGCYNSNFDYLWELEDVENYLKERYADLGLAW